MPANVWVLKSFGGSFKKWLPIRIPFQRIFMGLPVSPLMEPVSPCRIRKATGNALAGPIAGEVQAGIRSCGLSRCCCCHYGWWPISPTVPTRGKDAVKETSWAQSLIASLTGICCSCWMLACTPLTCCALARKRMDGSCWPSSVLPLNQSVFRARFYPMGAIWR